MGSLLRDEALRGIAADVAAAPSRDQALAALAARTARRGFAIAHDLLASPAEAEDAVQEALARACASYDRLRDVQALEGWFYRVLTNLCLRALRRRRVLRFFTGLLGSADDEPGSEALRGEPADGAPGAEEALATAGEQRSTLARLARLPAMQRAALILRYGHDLPVPEVARLLGVGPGTAKTHLLRGLARLRTDAAEAHAPARAPTPRSGR